jgi:tetratricopeptide (TPR) repeat protein
MGGGVLGKCCLQQGRLEEASAIVADAVRVISDKKLRGFHSADPLNAAAALCLALVDRARGAPRRSALRDARRACRKALHCARNAVGWMPEALRLYGTLAWFSGDFKSARARWQQSIAAAEKFAFPVEQARTPFEMAAG